MIKALVFDADGTILDSMKIWMEVTPRYLEQRGKKTTPEFERKLFSMSLEQGAGLIRGVYGITDSVEKIKSDILGIVGDFYRNQVQLKTGCREFLIWAKKQGFYLTIATAGNEELMKAALKRLEIESLFSGIFTCGKYNTDKSSPEIYRIASEKSGAAPEETVVFEDALVPVRTAKKALFKVVSISDSFSFKDKDEILKYSDIFAEDFTDEKIKEFIEAGK